MKKLLHLFLFVFTAGALVAQSVPNGGFENWTQYSWMNPTGYFSSDDQYVYNGYSANVVRVASPYHGTYAVQLTTTVSGPDTLQSYVANGNPGGIVVPGGVPYSQKPTGIRVYYKCNIMTGDTGLVLVIFKKNGSPIGGYTYKITGNVASYTLLAKTFSPALIFTPDTVVFAATPSNLLNNNFKGIPGSTLTIDSVTFTGVTSQPAAMNGDFENWTADTANMPSGWTGNYPGVFRTTDFYQGNYALELTTQAATINNNQAQSAYATTGKNTNNGTIGGYPFTNQIDTLSFYYKYAPVGADTANVYLEFKQGGSPIYYSGMYMLAAASYTYVQIPFNIGATPDSVIVSFQSTQSWQLAGNHIGSDLKVDNVHFNSTPVITSVNNVQNAGTILVYPNPVKDVVYVNAKKCSGTVREVAVYDMAGKLVERLNFVTAFGNTTQKIDMSNYSAGLYLIKVSTSTGSYCQKISKVE